VQLLTGAHPLIKDDCVTELTPSDQFLDLDDGATEVVASRPSRPSMAPLDGAEIAKASAGGRMQKMRANADAAKRDFLILRKAGQPPMRLVLTQAPVFRTLWRLWQAKRTSGVADVGVTVSEVVAAFSEAGTPLATSSVSSALRGMVKNEVVRVVDVHAGYRFSAKLYYPSAAGVEAFAIAEVLGDGAFVQVGRTARAWRRRTDTEPMNLFQHAALIRGWADPTESVESA
jgi:hypothetical protein